MQILSERRFHAAPLDQPLSPVWRQIGRWLGDLAKIVPSSTGGAVIFWTALAVLCLAGTVLAARRMLHRLAPTEPARGDAAATGGRADPRRLEREAAEAEQRGAFAEAVRLRFRAGLVTLAARGTIETRTSLRTGEISRRLRSADFDRLAASFDRVAYGGGTAGPREAAEAREDWRRVLAESR